MQEFAVLLLIYCRPTYNSNGNGVVQWLESNHWTIPLPTLVLQNSLSIVCLTIKTDDSVAGSLYRVQVQSTMNTIFHPLNPQNKELMTKIVFRIMNRENHFYSLVCGALGVLSTVSYHDNECHGSGCYYIQNIG